MEKWMDTIFGDSKIIFNYLVKPVFIIISALILLRLVGLLIDYLTRSSFSKTVDPQQTKRRNTLRGLLKNVAKYVIFFIAIVTILDCYNIPVMAILSTVGIVGVALAFGAQSLCRDMITGFFILLEDQFFVGEYIEAQGVAGYVEEFTLRCTYLRDFDGRLHIIPNGNMQLVTNHHRGNRRVMVEIGIAYDRDIGEALKLLQGVCDVINEEYKDVIRDRITAQGVVDMTASGVIIRMLGKSETMMQWDVEKALRWKALDALVGAGYDIPFPHSQVIVEEKGTTSRQRKG